LAGRGSEMIVVCLLWNRTFIRIITQPGGK